MRDTVQSSELLGYKGDMAQNTNPRKTVATEIKLVTLAGLDAESFVVEADATNPYAFVVKHANKTFRVIVKEMD